MKSIKIFAAAGAIALLGMAGLSSCKTNDEPETPGKYNGETVKTQFSIAFPEAVGAKDGVRKMPGTTVQAGENKAAFRGMEDIVLIPFLGDTVKSSDTRAGNNIVLPSSPSANTIASSDITDEGAKVFSNVSIPVFTKGFLFYAKAIDVTPGTPLANDKEKHTYGMLEPQNINGQPSSIGFNLVQINTVAKPNDGVKLVMYLNDILEASDNTYTWKECATPYPVLYGIYTKLITLTAGSSASVQFALSNMAVLLRNYIRTHTEGKDLAKAILTQIDAHATILTDTVGITLDDDYLNFPGSLNLPDGAAALTFNNAVGVDTFELAGTNNTNAMAINTATNNGLTNYVYPAALYYFVNSGLKVSTESEAEHYQSGSDWAAILGNYTAGNEVTLNTKSVAITKPIQYAVGRMDLTVTLGTNSLKANDPGDPSGEMTISTSSIPVTAVLIGGQKNVDYNFTPKIETVPYTIYDTTTAGYSAAYGSVSLPNYTLVLETAVDEPVNVALELTNNFAPFYGAGNQLIPQGSKFYLLGTLNPTDDSVGGTASDKSNTGGRVFKQDFKTLVKLTVGTNSLKSAYNTIPDLRATGLELGLSVDLTWRTGMSFDITL